MPYKTINVKPHTYEKLLQYKVLGGTFDTVINNMLDEIDPKEMYEYHLIEHRERLKAMESGEYVTLKDLKKKLGVK